ncbi:MAG TPA: class IV adenylate cyclase [Gemmatimonadaceae bacterium]|nr:class IV adenylate cyclase [Gemmatimonadaceae bacterium]
MPREVELKSVVDDVDACRRRLDAAGARVTFDGRLEDRRYDLPDRRLSDADQVLRVRSYEESSGRRAALDWKGPTRYENGYKVRDEISTATDAAPMIAILDRLGYTVVVEICRDVVQYEVGDTTVRFERYARMDTLVEVEGPPEGIERAVEALGMPRSGFTPDRFATFVARFEARTGERAIIGNAGQPHG